MEWMLTSISKNTQLYSDSKICAEKYADKIYEMDISRIIESGVKKTSDVIRIICA